MPENIIEQQGSSMGEPNTVLAEAIHKALHAPQGKTEDGAAAPSGYPVAGELVASEEIGADYDIPDPAEPQPESETQPGSDETTPPATPAVTEEGESAPEPAPAEGDETPLIDPTAALKPEPDPNAPPSDEELFAEPTEIQGNEKASERFQQLVGRVKEYKEQIDNIAPRYQQLEQVHKAKDEFLRSFQAQPQDMDRLARFSRALSAGTPEGLQFAWSEIETYRNAIAGQLGIRTETNDPLEQHADLKNSVEQMGMTREAALSEAGRRNTGNVAAQAQARDAAQASQQMQQQAMTTQITGEIQNLEMGWMSDPQYIAPKFQGPDGNPASLKDLMGQYTQQVTNYVMSNGGDPRALPGMIANYHNMLNSQLQAAPRSGQAVNTQGGQQQAMRGGTNSGRGAKNAEPQSTYEAIRQGLGMDG